MPTNENHPAEPPITYRNLVAYPKPTTVDGTRRYDVDRNDLWVARLTAYKGEPFSIFIVEDNATYRTPEHKIAYFSTPELALRQLDRTLREWED